MSRLPRPHIPFSIRVMVATRQLYEAGINAGQHARQEGETLKDTLTRMLPVLFGDAKVELHHRPALINRRRKKNGKYDPDANDQNHLVYLVEDEHDVETRIRGRNGAHSDLGLRRKLKRIEKKRATTVKARRFPKRAVAVKPSPEKRPWPSRPFAKGRSFNRRKA